MENISQANAADAAAARSASPIEADEETWQELMGPELLMKVHPQHFLDNPIMAAGFPL